eukprot:CAMPEP_0174850190 /NCGR_PEP_ID=MMETSP1114-20130205/19090_1 /TAXON_ID=312471 /ORGANISM="Neobodo designis, Strain CCAP 1951/1" /LENGTH=52 /DNA_ID=CAMNT_0016084627 /DNA_START=305 /DNA_END=460 /DNA_ORIENTATION=+
MSTDRHRGDPEPPVDYGHMAANANGHGDPEATVTSREHRGDAASTGSSDERG